MIVLKKRDVKRFAVISLLFAPNPRPSSNAKTVLATLSATVGIGHKKCDPLQKRVHKILCVERNQIVDFFSHADIKHRQFQLN